MFWWGKVCENPQPLYSQVCFAVMPRFLAIDTTTEVCSVALGNAKTCVTRQSTQANSHAKVVLQLIEEVLSEEGAQLNELDALALTIGPGSFTGIRIGLSVAQSLAYGAQLPIVCLTSLELLAAQCQLDNAHRAKPVIVCPALDARMGEIYWQLFELSQKGELKPLSPPSIGTPETFNKMSDDLSGDVLGVGHGWQVTDVERHDGFSVLPDLKPNAQGMLHIAQQRFENNELTSAFELEPLYLRNEITWQKRKRIRDN